MRLAKEEMSCMAAQIIDFASAVKELHGLSSQEINKLLRESESFTIQFHLETRLTIEVEKLVGCLPSHLIAMLISSGRDESRLRYLLCGLRLLHSFFDLAPRHTKLEQILLDDVKVPEQILDLVFLVLIILGGYRQENNNWSSVALLHSALLACSLNLLTGCLSSHWQELVPVLLAHPKVDVFMDAVFGAANMAIRFLHIKLITHMDYTNSCPIPEQLIICLCQQCEASIQFLQSLCEQKIFRERLLRNKELCGKGGVLFLAQGILKLNVPPTLALQCSTIVAAVSRLKAKMLSILLHLCEADSISYLDEVANSPRSLDLAKSVALEVLELLKAAVSRDLKHISACSKKIFPMGLLRLNAMRLADAFSDDSNLRSYITTCFTKVLTAIFLLPHGDFLSIWCSSELPPREEDATLEYDTFAAAGWVLDTLLSSNVPNTTNLEVTLIPSSVPQPTYAHHRTSLFVKVIANLHCFVPNICEEQERNLFLHKFIECMRADPSESLPGFSFPFGAQKAVTVSKNLRSLLSHAESLIPNFLNEEDVQLLRVFFNQLQSLINPADFEENHSQILENKFERSISLDGFSKLNIGKHHEEAQSTGGCSSAILRKVPSDVNNQNGDHKDEMSESSALQEEQLNYRSEHLNQADGVMKEDRDNSGGSASGFLREVDRDVQNVDTSGSDESSTREKNVCQTLHGDFPKLSEGIKEIGLLEVQGDEKVETVHSEEKQPRKRKRTIMNDFQMNLMENALLDEPDMHRNAVSLQSWADKLSPHGSEVTPSQLKNWLNNRKARLARAGKDARALMEVDTVVQEKQGAPARRHLHGSPVSLAEGSVPLGARGLQSMPRTGPGENAEPLLEEFVPTKNAEFKAGQNVVLMNGEGVEIGKGKIHQTQGNWYGKSLEESGTCVVDVSELLAERWTQLPYPSEATGTSFGEAETKIGVMRVLWDSNSIHILRDA